MRAANIRAVIPLICIGASTIILAFLPHLTILVPFLFFTGLACCFINLWREHHGWQLLVPKLLLGLPVGTLGILLLYGGIRRAANPMLAAVLHLPLLALLALDVWLIARSHNGRSQGHKVIMLVLTVPIHVAMAFMALLL